MLYTVGRSNGKTYIIGRLMWEGDERIPRERPIRLFGKTLFATKRFRQCLLRQPSLLSESADESQARGWYCPACRRVFAAFDVLNPREPFAW